MPDDKEKDEKFKEEFPDSSISRELDDAIEDELKHPPKSIMTEE